MSTLTLARYGKDLVRVFRTVRDPQTGLHTVAEYNVRALVEGKIETRYWGVPCLPTTITDHVLPSYTQADNSVVVAIDSSKYEYDRLSPIFC